MALFLAISVLLSSSSPALVTQPSNTKARLLQSHHEVFDVLRLKEPQATSQGDKIDSCSATYLRRELTRLRTLGKDDDPQGLLWKPWIEEVLRLQRQGQVKSVGRLAGKEIQLLMPRQRNKNGAVSYSQLAVAIRDYLKKRGRTLDQWSKAVFDQKKVSAWADFKWPPHFLKDKVPYISSYFDTHEIFDAGRTKKWGEPLEAFLKIVGVKRGEDNPLKLSSKKWTWVLSDRIQRNALVWDDEGRSVLFISMPCLSRLVGENWQEAKRWKSALQGMLLEEILFAYYLNGAPEAFLQDPNVDALVRGVAQSFNEGLLPTVPGKENVDFSFSQHPPDVSKRYRTAALWHFLYRLRGIPIVRAYIQSQDKSESFLFDQLNKAQDGEDIWLAFLAWSLSYENTPAALRMEVPLVKGQEISSLLSGVPLDNIEPPHGIIGSTTQDLPPHSLRMFTTRIQKREAVGALNIRWEPAAAHLKAYVFLADESNPQQKKFLGYAPMRPSVRQQVFVDPFEPPTHLYFFIVNLSEKRFSQQDLHVQIAVVPRPETGAFAIH